MCSYTPTDFALKKNPLKQIFIYLKKIFIFN